MIDGQRLRWFAASQHRQKTARSHSFTTSSYARRLRIEELESRQMLTADFGVNVVQNPGAEQGIDHWNMGYHSDDLEVRSYGGDSVPAVADRPAELENKLWYGSGAGDQDDRRLAQQIAFDFPIALVDSGSLYVDFSAYLGGWQHQDETDNARLWFRGENFVDVIQIYELIGPSSTERNDQTTLIKRELPNVPVPVGTRSANGPCRLIPLNERHSELCESVEDLAA
ncbi:hypothetical protein [Adhaeretor mobilis]|uniref:Uncharacterized protein n=1 Tax=Adhaeretor mobilis TaxID=1930276 RepID=A0A517N2W8_9BACT|nr:hypothetical protein [Adhaeretor mobilis]QDT01477.1 hypothetical protein HG15A2_48190 [Adhaeretor mobilis]